MKHGTSALRSGARIGGFWCACWGVSTLSGPCLANPAGDRELAPASVLIAQAEFWRQRGRSDIAREALQRVLETDPTNATALQRLEHLQVETAGVAPNTAPPARSDSLQRARAAGYAALNTNHLEEAASDFTAALHASPQDPASLAGLGLVSLRQQHFAEARERLDRALATASPPASAAAQQGWRKARATADFYARLQEAAAARDAGRYPDAEIQAKALCSVDYPDHYLAELLTAEVLAREGKLSEAQSVFARVPPGKRVGFAYLEALILRERARAFWTSADYPKAREAFQTALVAAPQDPWVRSDFARFVAHDSSSAHPNARLAANQLMEPLLRKEHPSAEEAFATALYLNSIGDLEGAAARLDPIPTQDRTPDIDRLQGELAVALTVRSIKTLPPGNPDRPTAERLHLLAARSNLTPSAQGSLVRALYDLGDIDGAVSMAREALVQNPLGEPASYHNHVTVLVLADRAADAQALLDRFRVQPEPLGSSRQQSEFAGSPPRQPQLSAGTRQQLDDLTADFTATLADRWRLAGRHTAAFNLLSAALRRTPDNIQLLGALARTYQSMQQCREALPIYERLLAHSPHDPDILAGAAAAALDCNQTARAETFMRSGLAVSPTDPRFPALRGRLERARDHPIAALEAFKSARRLQLTAAEGAPPYDTQPHAGPSDPLTRELTDSIHEQEQLAASRWTTRASDRERQGESGLSRLTESRLQLGYRSGLSDRGEWSLQAGWVTLDAGSLQGNSIQRLGSGALGTASSPSRQSASGMDLQLGYAIGALTAQIGSTPLGFPVHHFTADLAWSARLRRDTVLSVALTQQPVTDSLLAYSGTTDPVSSTRWGGVLRSGGALSISQDDGASGWYGQLDKDAYRGEHVASNSSLELRAGVYWRLPERDPSGPNTTDSGRWQFGAAADYLHFERDLHTFSLGQGGYFSPQQDWNISLPVQYDRRWGLWYSRLEAAVGLQHFRESGSPVFPLDPDLEATLERRAALGASVDPHSPAVDRQGAGFSGSALLEYTFRPNFTLRGSLSYNSFGDYREWRALVALHRAFPPGD